MFFPWTAKQVIDAATRIGYAVFKREHDLNLIGIRTKDDTANTFNDWFTVSHLRANGTWAFYAFQATTDPGLYWRINPINVNGTAIVVPGQYRGLWGRGKHQGKYDALVQVGKIKVYRDANKNAKLEAGKVEEGLFGINCHRANPDKASAQVDKWSAGCQVLADPDDFAFLLTLCHKQWVAGLGDRYSYTLLEEADL